MQRSFLSPEKWAALEFGQAALGDRRLTERLVAVATGLSRQPNGTLPHSFPNPADLMGTYRLLDHPEIAYQDLQQVHWQHSRQECSQPGEALIIEDTTTLDYTGRVVGMQLGSIGDGRGRGFQLHSSLGLRVESWGAQGQPQLLVSGLVAQQCLQPEAAPEGETRGQRFYRPRQSSRWAVELLAMGRPPQGCRWIYIADRESDITEMIAQLQCQDWDFVIRSCQDRRLAGQTEHLQAAIKQAPILGEMLLSLRSRPGQAARKAQVVVRCQQMELNGPWRPGGKLADFGLWVVEVCEEHAPAEVAEPLHWLLLTSLPCIDWLEVQRVIGRYAARWFIEEYHKAIKSGTHVEESQLEESYRLENLIGILSIVAVRLVSIKLLAQTRPEQPIVPEEFGLLLLKLLEAQFGRPEGPWTYRHLLICVARLGGFQARKHDGLPGWITIWRGWHRLKTMSEGVELLNHAQKRCVK